MTTAAYVFKRMYTNGKAANQAKREHPLLFDIMRETGFKGDSLSYPINYGNPQGISGTVGSAVTAVSSSSGVQPRMEIREKHGFFTISSRAMLASQSKAGAFVNLLRHETDQMLEEMGDRLGFDLYRNGTGVRGRRASIVGNVITLSDPLTTRNFKKNMLLIADDDATGASPKAGSTKVTAVDRKNGKITVENAAAIAGFADNDYLFAYGEPGTCIEGLAVLTPVTAPVLGVDSWRGIDRGSDVELLAGVRQLDTSVNTEDNIMDAAVACFDMGKRQDRYYINPIPFHQIVRRRGAAIQYTGGGGTAKIGFQFIVISTAGGDVQVFADPDAEPLYGYGMKMEEHSLVHLEEYPHLVKDDGLTYLRINNEDGLEGRARAYGNYKQRTPGCFSVVSTNQ
jgi:hypothetical protein